MEAITALKFVVAPFSLLLIALAILSSGCELLGSPNYEAENNELIATLPLFPGASEASRTTAAYAHGDSGPADGYGTRVTFRVPPGTTPDDVVGFYSRALPNWAVEVTRVPCGAECEIVNAGFRQGDYLITLGTANLTIDDESQFSFDLYADARAPERP
jgi:hypothetical protein